MIELDQVGFAYGPQVVVDKVTAQVGAGELVCIVGANGAGKTTLLKLIAGLLVPSRGQVRCFGIDPATAPRRQTAQRISFLPQSYQLAFPFTVSEVVLMGRYAHRGRGLLGLERPADLAAAQSAMERCDIAELADRRFDQISGGERRRVLLAQAFCQRTQLILLDEPTSSLDPAHAVHFFQSLCTELDDRSAVAVTHDLNLAARFADRVWVMDRGALVADGPAAEVLSSQATARAFGVRFHVGILPDTEIRFVVPR